jgi:hypothetical protein
MLSVFAYENTLVCATGIHQQGNDNYGDYLLTFFTLYFEDVQIKNYEMYRACITLNKM